MTTPDPTLDGLLDEWGHAVADETRTDMRLGQIEWSARYERQQQRALIDEQTAKAEQARAAIHAHAEQLHTLIDGLEDENDTLCAEVERLREALHQVASRFQCPSPLYGDGICDMCPGCLANAALASPPPATAEPCKHCGHDRESHEWESPARVDCVACECPTFNAATAEKLDGPSNH